MSVQCAICIDTLKLPVSLPCGHLFCQDCIAKSAQAASPHSVEKQCPTCRKSFSLVNMDPLFVPAHIRPHITPSVRRCFFDVSSAPAVPASVSPTAAEVLRLQAENVALKQKCLDWRKRAESQSQATMGLLEYARLAKDYAMQMKGERDQLHETCASLRAQLEQPQSPFSSLSPFYVTTETSPSRKRAASPSEITAVGDKEGLQKRPRISSPDPYSQAPTSPTRSEKRST